MIEVLTGPMYAGKTTRLLERLAQAEARGVRVVAIKPALDTRDRRITSRNGASHPCRRLSDGALPSYRVHAARNVLVAIDEAQFFGDGLRVLAEGFLERGHLLVAGLDLTSEREPFGWMPTLEAMAQRVERLTARCTLCGEPAPFTAHLGSKASAVKVGDEGYQPRCGPCWELAAVAAQDPALQVAEGRHQT